MALETSTNDSLRMLGGGCRCGSEMNRPLEIKMLLTVGATTHPAPYEILGRLNFANLGLPAIPLTPGRASRCKGFQANSTSSSAATASFARRKDPLPACFRDGACSGAVYEPFISAVDRIY